VFPGVRRHGTSIRTRRYNHQPGQKHALPCDFVAHVYGRLEVSLEKERERCVDGLGRSSEGKNREDLSP
jgi:hypothetical protein